MILGDDSLRDKCDRLMQLLESANLVLEQADNIIEDNPGIDKRADDWVDLYEEWCQEVEEELKR
jgi:hypothetical protein